ncbi:TonB-dependent receptor [Rhodovastum sp. RN2-1]|uniref:TonB-dependent receptor n=2 Tax=Limobrevibacterium gyesilva TaxID=2991712 RepID=A0AA42CJG3_9PROT|nr:TonB-dependent receptor [Limobrevibacterium gyesilva]
MLLATLFSSVAASAFAQDYAVPLPDLVVTATRIPTLIDRIPAGVTVISRAAIETHGYTTLVEALSTVPGLRVVQSGGPGGNGSVFVRGTNSNHVLVLRDGVPVNDPSDPGGLYNFGVDTLADIERIEVVRGPMSSLYGSGAIGGVINLITRKGTGAPHATAEMAFGVPRAAQGAAGLSGVTGKFDYSLNAESRADRGFDTTPQRESVYNGVRNKFKTTAGTINLGYTPIEGTRIGAYLRGRTSTFNLDEQGFPAYDASLYEAHDDAVYGRLGVNSKLFGGVWETAMFIARGQTDRHYIEPLEAADPNQTQSDTRYHGRRTELQWNNTVHLPDYGPSSDTALIFGYSHTLDSSHSVLAANFAGFPFQSNIRASATSNAGHAGLQTLLWQRLTLTADMREEDARYGGSAFTWRAGGVLAVPEVLSRFKASYGTSFRAPSLYDLFGVDTTGYMGNPNLRPERSTGYELGWAIDVPALGRRDAATLEVTYFNTRIRDLIQVIFAPNFMSSTTENVNRANIQGVESSLTLRPASWLETVLTYTWTDARDAATNARLLRRPVDAISASLRATPLPGLTVVPELIYTGAFQDFLIDDNGFPIGTGRAKPGAIVNLTVTYALTPQLALFANGRNLGSSRFEPASGFQTPGRSLLAGVRARF